jgi:hypothetical protein
VPFLFLQLLRLLDTSRIGERPEPSARGPAGIVRAGTGCTVTTPRGWPGFAISNRQVPNQNSRRCSRPNWPIEAGPDPAVHGVVRWRRVDLRDELQRRFGVTLHERSVGKVLAKLGYRKLQ